MLGVEVWTLLRKTAQQIGHVQGLYLCAAFSFANTIFSESEAVAKLKEHLAQFTSESEPFIRDPSKLPLFSKPEPAI